MRGQGLDDVLQVEEAVLSDAVRAAPSMLSYEERALLRWAARTVDVPRGVIVDAGAFLGGSALALADGLRARGGSGPSIHSYDLFRFAGDWERHWVPDGFDFTIGGSSEAIFAHTVREAEDLVVSHPGDIREARWAGAPINVLFVDVAKSWRTADHVAATFLPSLVPGESLVIQQDQVHWGHPWCAIQMELLSDHFEFLGWAWFSSAVYRSTSPVPAGALPPSLLRDLPLDDKLELVRRFARRLNGPIAESVRLSAAEVFAAHGRYDEARAVGDEVEATVGDDELPYISEGFQYLRDRFAKLESGREVAD
jgi:hypothetical protein